MAPLLLETQEYDFQGCERFWNDSQGWERNWNENSSYVNGNGTGTERVPVADFGTRTELSSTLAERNGTERSSEIFGTDPITDFTHLEKHVGILSFL